MGKGVGHNKSGSGSEVSKMEPSKCTTHKGLCGTATGRNWRSMSIYLSCIYLHHCGRFCVSKQRTGSEELVDKSPREVTVGSLFPIGRHDCSPCVTDLSSSRGLVWVGNGVLGFLTFLTPPISALISPPLKHPLKQELAPPNCRNPKTLVL